MREQRTSMCVEFRECNYTDSSFARYRSNFAIFCPTQRQLTYQPKMVIFDIKKNKNVALEQKYYVKYLGILIDKNLSWKPGLIAKLRHFLPTHTLLNR